MTHHALYTSQQVYQIEQHWFDSGQDSFGLMQQASWQMACWMAQWLTSLPHPKSKSKPHHTPSNQSACVWVGAGNNGGDGWLVAHYLRQFAWQVTVIEVAETNSKDAKRAKKIAIDAGCVWQTFESLTRHYGVEQLNGTAQHNGLEQTKPTSNHAKESLITNISVANIANVTAASVHIDAIFGIGLDRQPTARYAQAIRQFNQCVTQQNATAIAIDIPSGLVASTGQVFEHLAIYADITLCLIAQKIGLFTNDGKDHAGQVVTLPLIPLPQIAEMTPTATRLTSIQQLSSAYLNTPPINARLANSHKGSFGHVLVIGGNQTETAQGMGGASILTASAAFAVGVGKVSVACHHDYHSALLARLPNAMCLDLHNQTSVCRLIEQVDVVVIGMGLGREPSAGGLLVDYLQHAIANGCHLVIDADALYHLATTSDEATTAPISASLQNHATQHFVAYTPHSGEMARLLATTSDAIEADRLSAIHQAVNRYGGNWLLKGTGSLVVEAGQCYLCDAGNAGMATAGMGDVLAGVIAGLQAQASQQHLYNAHSSHNLHKLHSHSTARLTNHRTDYLASSTTLAHAVMLHALAGDRLMAEIGQQGLQAQDMFTHLSQLMAEY